MRARLYELLREASTVSGCEEIAIRCQCGNLERVYLEVAGERVVVTDRGATYGYLTRGGDSTYDPALLSEEQARSICERNGVEYLAEEREMSPRISRTVKDDQDVPSAVKAVASAIDETFKTALRANLR